MDLQSFNLSCWNLQWHREPMSTPVSFPALGQALWCRGLLPNLLRRCPKPDIFGRCSSGSCTALLVNNDSGYSQLCWFYFGTSERHPTLLILSQLILTVQIYRFPFLAQVSIVRTQNVDDISAFHSVLDLKVASSGVSKWRLWHPAGRHQSHCQSWLCEWHDLNNTCVDMGKQKKALT